MRETSTLRIELFGQINNDTNACSPCYTGSPVLTDLEQFHPVTIALLFLPWNFLQCIDFTFWLSLDLDCETLEGRDLTVSS